MGWWSGFPYLQTVLVIVLGGILGVTYSIPLRRALVTNSDLPYPEGVATISNDNLQDLKTGQLVDSTPWKQQMALVIAIDELLRRNSKYSLPPLAVGRGMYLPTAVTVMIPIGAALGHLYDRWAERTANPERAKRMGTLMATGLIVGESLAGVVYAGIVVAFGGKADPLAIMPEGFAGIAPWVGVVLFVGTLWYLYRGARQESTRD